jgi:chromosome partitioning protein
MMLPEEKLLDLWERSEDPGRTVASCVELVKRGRGELRVPTLQPITHADLFTPALWLLPGDLSLSQYEQELAEGWGKVGGGNERAVDLVTSIESLLQTASEKARADVVIIDVGPSLGALNHTSLIACDAIVIPVAPDLFSVQGLRNVGPTLRHWHEQWREDVRRLGEGRPSVRLHDMSVLGYVIQQHLARSDRPVEGYAEWIAEIPKAFHEHVMGESPEQARKAGEEDGRLALLKHFSSLVPIAQLHRKPLFDLRAAEGIGGGQLQSVAKARVEFADLSRKILARMGVATADSPVGR